MASVSYYLSIEGIEGDTFFDGTPGWIAVDSWMWAHGMSGPGPVDTNELRIITQDERSIPTLAQANTSGRQFPEGVLVGRKEDGMSDYLRIEMKGVTIASYQVGNLSTGDTMAYAFNLSCEATKVKAGVPTDKNAPSPQSLLLLHEGRYAKSR